jgi:regulator of sigma E protease
MKRSEAISNLVGLAVLAVLATMFWDQFRGPIIFVLTLGILIAVHEWGHFIAARSVGVRVFEFALGFGPKITTYMRRKGTEYTVRAIPAGGFVNLKGMMPDEPLTADGVNGRRPAERAIVYLAGPLMNIILAALVFCLTPCLVGSYDESKVLVGGVERKLAASQMTLVSRNGQPVQDTKKERGLRVGDQVLRVNDKPVGQARELTRPIQSSSGKEVRLTVQRKGDELVFTGVPVAEKKTFNRLLLVDEVPAGTSLALQPGDQLDELGGKMVVETADPIESAQAVLTEKAGQPIKAVVWRPGVGFQEVAGIAGPLKLRVGSAPREIGRLHFVPVEGLGPRLPFVESVQHGALRLVNNIALLFAMFGQPQELSTNVGGVISIGSTTFEMTNLPLIYWCNLLGSLSVSLAVFNLLPIPVLDGGHLLVLFWETIRRRRLDAQTYQRVYMVGLVVVLTLAIVITGKDIVKHFF